MQKKNRGFMSVLLWATMRTIALCPYFFRYYILQEILTFIFRDVLRYRRHLIIKQLSDSFPEKTQSQIRSIVRKYYSTLAEMIINTISLTGISDKEREARALVHGKGKVLGAPEGKDVIVLTSHFGFWEYYSYMAMRAFRTHDLYVAYHPLQNRVIDDYFRRIRSFEHCTPIPSAQTLRSFISFDRTVGKNLILGLVADQNAQPISSTPHFFRFLNHDTLFFNGGERLALKYRLPVYYLDMERIRRGYYRLRYELIYDGKEEVEQNEITRRYALHLEESIRRCPELWMWSHNRWKYTKNPITGEAVRVPYSRARQRRIEKRTLKEGKA